jgi:hypothetical protein
VIEILDAGGHSVKLEHIIESIRRARLRITEHADEEAQDDRLSFDEILASVLDGEIIEEYPDDKPFPSCLILGETADGEPVHSVWAYNEEIRWAVLVTVYRPDAELWINWRIRRPRNATI